MSTYVKIDIVPLSERHSETVAELLAVRRAVFVDRKGWSLNSFEGMEFDQYDRFQQTVYVVARHEGKILAGARLLRTDRRLSLMAGSQVEYSYMIRDAHLGLLEALPSRLCTAAPLTDPSAWECSRIFSASGARLGLMVFARALEYARDCGGETMYWIGPPAFIRVARSIGLNPTVLGDEIEDGQSSFVAASGAIPSEIKKP